MALSLTDNLILPTAPSYRDIAAEWKQVGSSDTWYGCAISSSGQYVYFTSQDYVYRSTDRGKTWSSLAAGYPRAIKCDHSGQYVLRVSDTSTTGYAHVSNSYGESWTSVTTLTGGSGRRRACAVSGNGAVMVVGFYSGRLYMSTDYGVNWSEIRPKGDADGSWYAAAIDYDGSHIFVVDNTTYYISTNGGSSWSTTGTWSNTVYCNGAAMSDDGSKILVGQNPHGVYLSTDSGGSWSEIYPAGSAVSTYWYGAAMNSDGSIMCVSTSYGAVYTYDQYQGWRKKTDLTNAIYSISITEDGERCWIGEYNGYRYYGVPFTTSASLPVVYGNLEGGADRWEAVLIEKSSKTYAYAGHPVLSEANGNIVRAWIGGVQTASFTFDESVDFQNRGLTIATLTFTSTPTGTVTVSGSGKVDTSGNLIESPLDIVSDILVDYGGYDSSDIDFQKSARIVSFNGYKAAGVIDRDAPLIDVLNNILGSFLGTVKTLNDGSISAELMTGSLSTYGAIPTIIRACDIAECTAYQSTDDIINQLAVRYCYSWASQDYLSSISADDGTDTASIGIYGEMPYTADLAWVSDEDSAVTVRDIILGWQAKPKWQVDVTVVGWRYILLEPGDIVCMTVMELYDTNGNQMRNEYWRVLETQSDLGNGRVKLRLIQADGFLTTSGGLRDTTLY